jgi:KDO2-lipid IV(A) lauroyltransferase
MRANAAQQVRSRPMAWHVRLLALLLALAGRVPLRALHAIGAGASRLAHWLGTREYRVARRNAELCFPGFDEDRRRAFVRATLAESGRGLAELPRFWSGDPQRALGLIRHVHGREHVDAALAAGRGLLIAAPHLGAWELLNLYLRTLGPLTILYRVPQRPEFEPLLVRARTALGAEAVRAEAAGVRLLFRRLKEGRIVGILPDQRPKGGEGVDAPFHGHPVRTMTLLSRLAHKTGAPVVFGFAERLPRGAGFTVHFLAADSAIADADPVVAATALNRGIEACVRLAPAQYQWTYKRFSYREDGDTGPDPVYGKWKRKRKR